MFRYEIVNHQICIKEYIGEDVRVEVPEEIDGYPVRKIGAYAFSQKDITHLTLPGSIEKIGRYAFYLCVRLVYLSFYSSIKDLGAGALTGCHNVKTFRVQIVSGEPSCLKDFLNEISEEICVEYCDGPHYTRLMFPEFYEEGVENTPARIIESHTHGSGVHYRNAFLHRDFQFQEYDNRFSMAVHQESLVFNLELALGRLQYPYQLSENARKVYLEFCKKHLDWAIDYLTRRRETEKVSFLMDITRERKPAKVPDFDL